MPLPNRVDPFGTLFAVPQRGTLLGNRGGQFHDAASQTLRTRPYANKQWICCRLSFKDRRRNVWGKGYTELFFLDDYTALAAGHRPCFECRREDATAFAAAWGRATGTPPPLAPDMDAILHRERLDGQAKRLHNLAAETLPDGTIIAMNAQPWLVRRHALHRWSFAGYGESCPFQRKGIVTVVTPPAIIACLQAGYEPSSR